MKQSLEEAAYQYEQKALVDADIKISEEEESYYKGLEDGVLEVASKAFIAGAKWQRQVAVDALDSVLESWLHGGDEDYILAEFEEMLNNV